MSINKVFISGNITRDPDLRSTASGMPVLSFGMAVNDRKRNPQTNEWEDYANFVDCTMFGPRAEALEKHLSKGTKLAVEGKLRYSQWERDGQKRSKLEVVVDELEFMSARNQAGANNNAPGGSLYDEDQLF
ncbi:MAG: single-stranded DNA-binding protein [Bacteroidales bacterium]|nr:single-stranded DNA-binding protein [Bacteroidales bacterium]